MTKTQRYGLASGILLLAAVVAVQAGGYGQQYYGSWNYYPARGYSYCSYYYKPYVSYPSYSYHYCICYPQSPSYVYYYNPHRGYYWGRYDLNSKGYSLLAEKDRKATVAEIPETAFPKAGQMPIIPAAVDDGKEVATKGDVRIEAPPAPPAVPAQQGQPGQPVPKG